MTICTYREWHSRDNSDTRNSDSREEESGHSTKDSAGDCDKCCGKLREDTHDDQPEAAKVSGFAVGTAGECNDSVVLCKGGHWSDGAKTGKDTVQTIGQDTA
jgi:hypothetical protein